MRLLILVPTVVLALVLTSGYVDINFEHNLHLPKELTNQNTVQVSKHLFGSTTYDIYLKDTINTDFAFREVIQAFDNAKDGDKINMHMAGNGGSVDVVLLIINHMLSTKAFVTTIVEAPVYSGHAYISMFGKKIIMRPYTFMMLHTSSAFGYDCSKEKGTDRTVSNVEHCERFLHTHLYETNKLLMAMPVLTPEEKVEIINGHSFYLTADDFNERTKNANTN